MTRLESLLNEFEKTGLSEYERQSIYDNKEEPPHTFKQIAKEILDGCFVITSGNESVKVIPTDIEIYYHEENGKIKDEIVYHRNKSKDKKEHENICPFELGTLHNHVSGIDITFEFNSEHGICRASALIRQFRIVGSKCNETYNMKDFETRPTYLYYALFGQFSIFNGFNVKWSDTEQNSDISDIICSRRIGMDKRNHNEEEIKEAARKWNFMLS